MGRQSWKGSLGFSEYRIAALTLSEFDSQEPSEYSSEGSRSITRSWGHGMNWEIDQIDSVYDASIFSLEKIELLREGERLSHPYHRLKSGDFANIFAMTPNSEIVLVRQYRVGSECFIVEVPGGMVDKNEDPKVAAMRELEEETGYICDELMHMSSVNPNPAIMTNKLHMYLGLNAKLNENRQHFPDANECLEVVTFPIALLKDMVSRGEIDSALAALTIHLGLSKLAELDEV